MFSVPGMLELEDGSILKALQKAPRGTRELDFYRKICDSSCTDKHILQLQQLLPEFRGTFHFDEYPEGIKSSCIKSIHWLSDHSDKRVNIKKFCP